MWLLKKLKYWEIPIHFDIQKYQYVEKCFCSDGLLFIEVITPVKDTFKIFDSVILKIDLNIGKIVSTELWTIDNTNKEYPYISFGAMRYKDTTNKKYNTYTQQELLDMHIEKLNTEVQKRLEIEITRIALNDIKTIQNALVKYAMRK